MIFVTVGTHEQPFDRLIKKIDDLCEQKVINEKVFFQLGYSNYIPKSKNCVWERLISFNKMNHFAEKSRIIITHGGPGCIIQALQRKKIPIVVPRQHQFNEHVDNHQVMFTKRMENAHKIIAVYNIESLSHTIIEYDSVVSKMTAGINNNTVNFVNKLEKIVMTMFD